jgi:hypothetical protein
MPDQRAGLSREIDEDLLGHVLRLSLIPAGAAQGGAMHEVDMPAQEGGERGLVACADVGVEQSGVIHVRGLSSNSRRGQNPTAKGKKVGVGPIKAGLSPSAG